MAMLSNTAVNLHNLYTNFDPSSVDSTLPLQANENVTIKKISAQDVYEHACNITAWQQIYDQIYPGQFFGQVSEVWLDGLQLCKESTNLALRQSCVIWPSAIWFGLPKIQERDSFINSLRITEQHFAACPGGAEFELLTPDEFEIIGLGIQYTELEHFVQMSTDKPLDSLLNSHVMLQASLEKRKILWSFIEQILHVAECHPHRLLSKAVRKNMKDHLLTSIIELLLDASPPEKVRYSQQNYRRIVSQAREYVLASPEKPITILDLCALLHVSRRTLQNAFQNILNICPLSFLKAIRLNAVRRELLSTYSRFHTVQDTATAWGFWHLSQFASDYQRLFNELPSETLAARKNLHEHLLES